MSQSLHHHSQTKKRSTTCICTYMKPKTSLRAVTPPTPSLLARSQATPPALSPTIIPTPATSGTNTLIQTPATSGINTLIQTPASTFHLTPAFIFTLLQIPATTITTLTTPAAIFPATTTTASTPAVTILNLATPVHISATPVPALCHTTPALIIPPLDINSTSCSPLFCCCCCCCCCYLFDCSVLFLLTIPCCSNIHFV